MSQPLAVFFAEAEGRTEAAMRLRLRAGTICHSVATERRSEHKPSRRRKKPAETGEVKQE